MLQTNAKTGQRLARDGFFAIPDPDPVKMQDRGLQTRAAYPATFVPCRDSNDPALTPCHTDPVPDPVTRRYRLCRTGYEGFKCSKCAPSYFHTPSGVCHECPDSMAQKTLFAIAYTVAVAGIVLWSMLSATSSGCVKVLALFLQFLGALDPPQPSALRLFARGGSQLASLEAPGAECYVADWSFRQQFAMAMLGPLALAFLVTALYVVGRCVQAFLARRRGYEAAGNRAAVTRAWNERCSRSLMFLLSLQFFGFVGATLVPLACESFPDPVGSRLKEMPSEKCSGTTQIIAAMGLVVYGFGAPLLVAWIAKRTRSTAFDQFHESYRPGAKYWEVVLTCRRIVFLVMSTVVPYESAFRVMSQGLLLLGSAAWHVFVQPFVSSVENGCEMVSFVLLVLNLLLSSSGRSSGVSQGSIEAISVVLFCMNGVFVTVLVLRIAWMLGPVEWIRRRLYAAWGSRMPLKEVVDA